MSFKCNLSILLGLILSQTLIQGRGLLLLYRPRDITYDCISSEKLRYDLSFGMGMSDTITLVFRTIPDIDYECEVDVNSDSQHIVYVVIRYPNNIGYNCEHNFDAFRVKWKNECHPVCTLLDRDDIFTKYWLIIKKGRFRFQFRSNSSVNTDMEAHLYEVTVTTARRKENEQPCARRNETECYDQRNDKSYCMTSGIVCDGIKNCGVEDWYDERKSECETIGTRIRLDYPSILAVIGLLFCLLTAAVHTVLRCLPKATSFFVFSTNADNALALDPVFQMGPEAEAFQTHEQYSRRKSLIPVEWSDSSDEDFYEGDGPKLTDVQKGPLSFAVSDTVNHEKDTDDKKKSSAMRQMSQRISQRLRSVVVHLSSHESPDASHNSVIDPLNKTP